MPPSERRRLLTRLGAVVVIVAAATALRAVLDPLVGDQIPYLTYLGGLVLGTWLCGLGVGIATTVLAALVGDYFFIAPRHDLIPRLHDWMAMGLFSAVGLSLAWLVARWRGAETVLRQQVDELETIFDTVPAALFVTRDPQAAHMTGNRLAAEYLRLPPDANLSKTAPPGERPATFKVMKDGRELQGEELPVQTAISRAAEVRDCEFDIVYQDGTGRPLFGNVAPLRDERGQIRGSVGAFIDMSERRRLESEVRQRVEDLDQANRIKDEFLATLSHELRTPLNAIVGWADMLRTGKLTGEAADRAVESIYRNAQTQSQMINDVLDVSRIISGRTRLDLKPADPVAVLQHALDAVRPAADAKGVRIVTDFHRVRVPVYGDASRLQQVFWNLLSNAIKFTPSGGEVRVVLRSSQDEMLVEVVDTGMGISAEFLPHVFERFRQHDSSSTRRYGGLGLGLAIVRHLVELHGGTVTAASAGPDQGATFRVRLPAASIAERRQSARPMMDYVPPVDVADEVPSLCGVSVLAVDDEPEALQVTSAVLRHHGATVLVAGNAGEALKQLEVVPPTVLLIDLAMPEVDGYMLIERIRARPASTRTPAIALTAYAREEDRRRALSAGFDMHLAKPVDTRTLVRAVASMHPRRRDNGRQH